ncbi:hypothetical protein PVIIG_05783 [Plasmodium vivax India VII]|uniref:Uncharacterized protein n=1 Tax=Plasmodium vivax India VII TaxID=1077284 RepID=A0A0J9S1H2_PLAVI|nr:hypothetical protein PVIIG_05783 [Plasmodium vivax India VII]
MKLLNNYYIWGNVNFTAPLKIITFILLICIYFNYNDMREFTKSIEKLYEYDNILNIKFKRLLARYEKNSEFEHNNLREKLS